MSSYDPNCLSCRYSRAAEHEKHSDPYAPIRADDGTCTVCRRYTDEAFHGACLIKAGAL